MRKGCLQCANYSILALTRLKRLSLRAETDKAIDAAHLKWNGVELHTAIQLYGEVQVWAAGEAAIAALGDYRAAHQP